MQNWLNSRYAWRSILVGLLLLGGIVTLRPHLVHADRRPAPEQRPAALAGICDSVTTIPRAECDALVAFYNETDGPHWTSKPRWLQTSFPCYWGGVQCTGGHVTSLTMFSNRVSGPIPLALTSLPLQSLDLDSNELTGAIPPELGTMTSLTSLSLSNNRLSGSIPGTLGNLSNLTFLSLYSNMLAGEVPSSLVQLSQVQKIFLWNNMLTASDPALIAFLDRVSKQWRLTQTVPPTGVTPNFINQSRVDLTWDRFLEGNGYYEVGYASTPGGPYTSGCVTANKWKTTCGVQGLLPQTLYYFAVRTYTPSDYDQKNELWSSYGTEVAVRTGGPVFTCDEVVPIPPAECLALTALYNQTGGPTWKHSTNWLQSLAACYWDGVTCRDGHVTSLRLDYNGLGGPIPPELGNLSQLTSLSLSENDLTGSLSASLGSLGHLKKLDLGYNLLTGTIPSSWGDLANLEYLSLRSNDLSGSIPTTLGNLALLQVLMLDKNWLGETIPAELGNLSHLDILYLQANQLSGAIPPQLGNLSGLSHLYLYGNRLSGPIPPELGNLSQLTRLYLMANQLEGEIPPELANLTQLQIASTTFNMLWTNDPAVQALLDRTDSPLWSSTQTLPPTDLAVSLSDDRTADLTWTPIAYTGDGGYYEVRYAIHPQGPYHVGCITPDKTASGCTVEVLPGLTYYFDMRTYTPAHSDPLGDFWPQQNYLRSAYTTSVEVTTPGVFCEAVSEIPRSECEVLLTFYDANPGGDFRQDHLMWDWLESLTPCADWNGVVCAAGHVTELQLHGDYPYPQGWLSGTLSPELGQLTYLEKLDLGENRLTGGLPLELTTLAQLQYLDLYGNLLEGPIPPEIGNLTALTHLDLMAYYWTGTLPVEIANLTNLEYLALGSDLPEGLGGPIPVEYAQLSNLTRLYVWSRHLSGSIPPEVGSLTNLTVLSLCCELEGPIPPEIGQLTRLGSLWLSQNHLSGPIPDEIGQLTQLEDLTLSCNRLEGEIPASFANLTRLRRYYITSGVDYNMLTASDPAVIARLESFDATWDETQTIPPSNVQVERVDPVQVRVSWTPIPYTADGGYYAVLVATTPGGPYTEGCRTADKTASACEVTGLSSLTPYYFVVQTFTPANRCGYFAHTELGQPNDLLSTYSEEVTITTGQYLPPAGCYPLESDPSVILCTSN